ncbi:hypothetical protein Lser_V15G13789 [Lactuca serriola]
MFNSIIDTFGKSGELGDALQVFDQMQQEGITPDITTWNSLIKWHCKHGDLTNSLVLFNEMQTQGLYPDPGIFITIISRLGEQGKWDIIKKNFEQMKDGDDGGSGIIYVVLVDIYGQHGSFEDAEDCINTLKLEGVPLSARIFCVLANAYGQQGAGASPDVVTYTTLMKALLRAKKFDKVGIIYRDMESAGCSLDRKARQLLQTAIMVLDDLKDSLLDKMSDYIFEIMKELDECDEHLDNFLLQDGTDEKSDATKGPKSRDKVADILKWTGYNMLDCMKRWDREILLICLRKRQE